MYSDPKKNNRKNAEGYSDPTASNAVDGPVHYPEEELYKDECIRSGRLITAFVQILKDTDFEFACHVRLRSKKSGDVFG